MIQQEFLRDLATGYRQQMEKRCVMVGGRDKKDPKGKRHFLIIFTIIYFSRCQYFCIIIINQKSKLLPLEYNGTLTDIDSNSNEFKLT